MEKGEGAKEERNREETVNIVDFSSLHKNFSCKSCYVFTVFMVV